MKKIVLSLCDVTGVMVQPWLEAGYDAVLVDIQHAHGTSTYGRLTRVGCDVTAINPTHALAWWNPAIVFAFPPCTHLAGSGARWFQSKGLESLHEALGLVIACKRICEASGSPWMLENPVGSLSTYWRPPDYTFQPWQYGNKYTKKTCLWTGHGFEMPDPWFATKPDGVVPTIHLMPPSKDRAAKRSVTPDGFAKAVFERNEPKIRERVA